MAVKPSSCNGFVSTVTIGERGQIVIPAEVRKSLDIHPGDRMFIMGHPGKDGLIMFKVDAMREFLVSMADSLSMVNGEADEVRTAQEKASSETRV